MVHYNSASIEATKQSKGMIPHIIKSENLLLSPWAWHHAWGGGSQTCDSYMSVVRTFENQCIGQTLSVYKARLISLEQWT